jgi:hypothetical protein
MANGFSNQTAGAPVAACPGGGNWSLSCVLDILCKKDPQAVAALQNINVEVLPKMAVEKWKFDGTAWTVTEQGMGGGLSDDYLAIDAHESCEGAAVLFHHELVHYDQEHRPRPAGQPPMTRYEAEKEAYTKTAEWEIASGVSASGYTKGVDPNREVDTDKIERNLQKNYAQKPHVAGQPDPPVVEDHYVDQQGQWTIVNNNGAMEVRPSQAGDEHMGKAILPPGSYIPKSDWKCPKP